MESSIIWVLQDLVAKVDFDTKMNKTISDKLRNAGLRPTRQRLALAELLFGRGDRHVTAEELHDEACRRGIAVSLATVYNTLHQFTAQGLLREVAVEGATAYFDTNTSNHYHFLNADNGELIDIDNKDLRVEGLPTPPAGMKITRVDVLVHIEKDDD